MDPSALAALLTGSPAFGIAALAIYALYKKDGQCTALAAQLTDIAAKSAVSNQQVASSIDALRDAIRQGTKG